MVEGFPKMEKIYWCCVLMLFLFSLSWGIKIFFVLWWNPRKVQEHFAKQGIKGPPYHFLIGNIIEIVWMMRRASAQPMPISSHKILPRVLSFYHYWKKIYGAPFLIWFGSTPRLAISEPDLIREILASSSSKFYEKNDSHPLVKKLEGDGLLSLKGRKWLFHRKIISPFFHMENLNILIPIFGKIVLEKIHEISIMEDSIETELDVSVLFQRITEDIIARTTFGENYEEGKLIFRLQAQQMLLAAEAFQKFFIPGYRFLPTKKNIRSWNLDREIKQSLTKIISRRRKNSGECFEGKHHGKDLLGLMIKANSIPDSGELSSGMMKTTEKVTVKDIVEECKTFFFAGKETTSNLLTWTTILLAMHPDWQELARDEVRTVCGSRDIPTQEQVSRLKTLSMILNESLRLYPPAIATIRRARTDVELGSYKIPKGTELLIPILAVHHDPSLWGRDASKFKPDRFSGGVIRAAHHPISFIPFGIGSRTCIGQNLPLLLAKITLSLILQRFSFRLSPAYRHAPTVLMLLYPQHGAPIIFRPLSEMQEHSV